MPPPKKLRIGELFVQEGLVTPDQVEQALSVQKNQQEYRPLGEIFVDMKFITKTDLRRILKKHHKHMHLGDLLVNLGMITGEQLLQVLEEQKTSGKRVGELLVSKGIITEASLINALVIQLGIPKIIPDINLIDKNLLKGLNVSFLKKNGILPAFKHENVLTLIAADPLIENTISNLGQIFQCEIEIAVAPLKDILNTINRYYGKVEFGTRTTSEETKKDLIIGGINLSLEKEDTVSQIVDYIITNGVRERASDIHIEPKEQSLRIRYRIDGILHHKTDLPIHLAQSITSRIKVLSRLDVAEKRKHQDGRIEARIEDKEVDLRISTYVSVYGENVVIRILHRQTTLIDLDLLGFSPLNRRQYMEMLNHPSGVILVTGPTGSGKTTTLYASLQYLVNLNRMIITVEDPVEYYIDGVVQGQLNPKLGLTYIDHLKSMMRQDPDVLMIGEIRDHSAAEAVIQAALTGHKVLSTFHTDDTTGALLRLMDMGIDTFLISSTVVSVVAQRLVRVLCPHCRQPYELDPNMTASLNIHSIDSNIHKFYQAGGCSQCNYTGFKGRIAIHELLVVNDAIREAILARKTSSEIRYTAREKANLVTMLEDGFYKATKGMTSLEEIFRVIFCSESDDLSPRSADEVIALCEDKDAGSYMKTGLPEVAERTTMLEADTQIFKTPSTTPVLEGEFYRIRFDPNTIEVEPNRIEDFFHAYQGIRERLGQPIASNLLDYFADFIIKTVRQLHISRGAEFVEFSLTVKEDKVIILLETLLHQQYPASPVPLGRETGIRLLNHLGIRTDIGERTKIMEDLPVKDRAYRKRSSLIEFLIPQSSPLRSSATYKRHAEAYDFEDYLSRMKQGEINKN
ncbi:MAG: type IV pilus assembly protein PilB [bacterium]|nr:MAG: type IV pilus assembly protein PilB [bacterium]